jgi:hypothetical protein
MTDTLINTLEAPGEFDALTKLRPGEPYFPLVGRDRLAPPLVQQWATDNRMRALREHDDGKISDEDLDRELRKSTQAEAIGWAMQAYKAGRESKKAEVRAQSSYVGAELPEDTEQRDQIQSLRARASQVINAAVGEVAALLEVLDPYLERDSVPVEVRPDLEKVAKRAHSVIDQMRRATDTLTPSRQALIKQLAR